MKSSASGGGGGGGWSSASGGGGGGGGGSGVGNSSHSGVRTPTHSIVINSGQQAGKSAAADADDVMRRIGRALLAGGNKGWGGVHPVNWSVSSDPSRGGEIEIEMRLLLTREFFDQPSPTKPQPKPKDEDLMSQWGRKHRIDIDADCFVIMIPHCKTANPLAPVLTANEIDRLMVIEQAGDDAACAQTAQQLRARYVGRPYREWLNFLSCSTDDIPFSDDIPF